MTQKQTEDRRRTTGGGGLKISRVRNRVYQGDSRRVKRNAEYAIVVEDETVAHLIKVNGWIVVEGHTDSKFGLPVSPLNLRLIRELRKWAAERQWAVSSEQ